MSAPSVGEGEAGSGTPEGLPDLTQVPEDQRDAVWLKHYYAGDKPQLTVRAVVIGGVLGAVMSICNLYTTLKVGWAFGVAITACVLSYTFWEGIRRVGLVKSEMTILENNCMQSTASAAGYSTGGTLATAVGALLLITGDEGRLGWAPVAIWVGLTALLGVFLAIPMKRQMINSEQLAFPSGIAAAETLRSLYAKGRESVLKARALIISLVVGILVGLFRDALGWIPASFTAPFTLTRARGMDFTGERLNVGVEVGVLLIAAGMIVGMRVSGWMAATTITSHTLLANYALSQEDWTEEGRTYFGHVESISLAVPFEANGATLEEGATAGAAGVLGEEPAATRFRLVGFARPSEEGGLALARSRAEAVRAALVAGGMSADRLEIGEPTLAPQRDAARVLFIRVEPGNADRDGRPITMAVRIVRWTLWLGAALLVASGLTSFALGWRSIARAFGGMRKKKDGSAAEDPVAHLEVPTTWLALGMVPVTIGLMILCVFAFDIAWWMGLLSVILSFVLALVACRATGETDTTPIGAMGKITQFIYAVLAPANTTVNLMTAGVTAGAAGSAADLLTDLKSGYLLGANPRQQFIAQLSGVFFGIPAVMIGWYALVPDAAHLEAFNSPATSLWFAVAQALSNGIEVIPATARMMIVVGGILGIVLALAEALTPKKLKRFVPSSMGIGLALIMPFANAFAFFIGAAIAEIWSAVNKKSAEAYLVAIASGAIAGESIASAGIAIKDAATDMLSGGGSE